jgi:extradiol dioxygenase family protein
MASGAIQSAPPLARLDHLVLTVASIDETVRFYTNVLGMTDGNLVELATYLKP